MTEKRRKFNQWLLVALGAGLILLALLVATTSESEPEYAGKTLSEWLEGAQSERSSSSGQSAAVATDGEPGPATTAIRQIGDRALPFLVARLQQRETWLSRAWRQISFRFEFVPPPPYAPHTYQLAAVGFEILGTNAWPAIPELSRILVDANFAGQTAASLCALGDPGVKAVHAALLDPEVPDDARAAMIRALSLQKKIDQTEILPVVMTLLNSPNPDLSFRSAFYLVIIHGDPAIVVPQIISHLEHPELKTRAALAGALGTYGAEAVEAVPKLEALLTQPDELVGVETLHDIYQRALQSIRSKEPFSF